MKKKRVILKGIKNKALKNKLGNKCVYCGCTNPLVLEVDHKKALSRGGKNIDSNKQICCVICNRLKDKLSDGEFKLYYKNLISLSKLHKVSCYIADPKITFHQERWPIEKQEVEDAIIEEINSGVKEKTND